MERLTVIGGGLAGCEAAWQAARLGVEVDLYEMRPHRSGPAHTTGALAELVCSNSLRGAALGERRRLAQRRAGAARFADRKRGARDRRSGGRRARRRPGAFRRGSAGAHRRPIAHHAAARGMQRDSARSAGDRRVRSAAERGVLGELGCAARRRPAALLRCGIADRRRRLARRNGDVPAVALRQRPHDRLRTGDDYLNIPLDRAQYAQLLADLRTLERHAAKSFEETRYFEGCLPIEEMADRGDDVLRFGPLKPVGLARSAHRPAAVRGRAAAQRERRRDGLQPRRLSDAACMARAARGVREASGFGKRRVAAPGRDAPQHVHRLAASAGRTLAVRTDRARSILPGRSPEPRGTSKQRLAGR